MRKKKMKKIILAVLVIVLCVIVISKIMGGKTEEKKKLLILYEELNASQTYLFEMQESEKDKTIMAKKGEKTIIDDYTEDSHSTTIVKDNNTYLVLHDREEYYVYEQNNVEQTILTDGLKEVVNKEFVTGTEKVKGQKYSYEEFQGSTMFMESNSLDVKEDEVKTRFYFDNNDNLVYIRTIKGVNQELLKINIQKDVDDSIFEVPSHYAEN